MAKYKRTLEEGLSENPLANQMIQPEPVLLNEEFVDDELNKKVERNGAVTIEEDLTNLIEDGSKIFAETVLDDAEQIYKVAEDKLKSEPITFVSANRGLNVLAQVLRRNAEGKIVRVGKVFEFRNGSCVLTDPYEITAMRKNESYGGDGSKDPVATGKEPLFWENAFPRWKMKMLQEHESLIRNTRYEPAELGEAGQVY